jgi:hypothetical protein
MQAKKITKTATPAPAATAAATVAVARPPAWVTFENLRVEWKPRSDGSAELVLAYEGPLARRDEVVARAGTWRQGSAPWNETSELPLRREGSSWVGAIPVRPGAPVEAVEFVFRAGADWDNGGRAPLGYYEWTPRDSRIAVR